MQPPGSVRIKRGGHGAEGFVKVRIWGDNGVLENGWDRVEGRLRGQSGEGSQAEWVQDVQHRDPLKKQPSASIMGLV